jgi:hypothetical protein
MGTFDDGSDFTVHDLCLPPARIVESRVFQSRPVGHVLEPIPLSLAMREKSGSHPMTSVFPFPTLPLNSFMFETYPICDYKHSWVKIGNLSKSVDESLRMSVILFEPV